MTYYVVSIHAPRAGRDNASLSRVARRSCFNPRAPRGARPLGARRAGLREFVSIHAPRAGRDEADERSLAWVAVSIHAPRAGRDDGVVLVFFDVPLFQSTRPARGATRRTRSTTPRRAHTQQSLNTSRFNPRAPRGARPLVLSSGSGGMGFQSTRPARGATLPVVLQDREEIVSIHAPRAGRDVACIARLLLMRSFNPRAPRGARHALARSMRSAKLFQSTRPARGATATLSG